MPLVDWFQDPDKVTVELHLGDVNGAIALRVFHRAERPEADERAHHLNASSCVRGLVHGLVQRSIARTVSKTRLLRRNFRRKTEFPRYRITAYSNISQKMEFCPDWRPCNPNLERTADWLTRRTGSFSRFDRST